MAKNFYVTAKDNYDVAHDDFNINSKRTYSFDFSAWAEDNNNVASATWTVKRGQAAITGQALASNVATAQIEGTEEGKSIIEILADTGTEKYSAYLNLYVRDPNKKHTEILTDYI